jgi:GH15 family glucan-1,4-alpha-glucosidase
MSAKERDLNQLNDQIKDHFNIILKCTVPSKKYGKLLLASPPDTRYPYVYPRDCNCATQLFRRVAGSKNQYDVASKAFELMESMARFMKDVQSPEGMWGQRYSLDGEDKSIYKQEDNVAHGIAIICNYLLTAKRLEKEIPDLDDFMDSINKGLEYCITNFYQKELNLFYSNTSIHESGIESGYTICVNFAFLFALSLAHEIDHEFGDGKVVSEHYLNFRNYFLYSVSELFMSGARYIRRVDPEGRMDMRPDFTLLSPFYFGFLHYEKEMERSVDFLEKQLSDPELNMIMRYLPFNKDFDTHIHAGNGPWLQYTAILAQFHYWKGNAKRGDELLSLIDDHRNERGEIPEHLSTCQRFEYFMENEWKTGGDFEKEFYKPILLEKVDFDNILEEANNMSKSYEETGKKCIFTEAHKSEGGYIQFATPLMWSHAEYVRALMVRAKDWWKI